MTEAEIKIQARLFALEYVLANTISSIYLMSGVTRSQIEQIHANARTMLDNETIPGAPPEQGDMWLGEIQEAVASVQSVALSIWEARKAAAAGLG
jgi:hypothetical protein